MVDGLAPGRMQCLASAISGSPGGALARRLPEVRTLHAGGSFRTRGLAVATVVLAIACTTTSAPDNDGGPPAPVFCQTDAQCPSGTNCTFPIDVGCTALGECRDVSMLGDPADGECTPAGPACACNGQTIQVPACWDSLAPVAVFSLGPCGVGDAGVGDGATKD